MKKSGQMALFIIIGIILLIIVITGSYFYYFNVQGDSEIGREKSSRLPSDIIPIYDFVESCIKSVSVPGIYLLAAKGGYIYSYDNVLLTNGESIAYHVEYGDDVAPSRQIMQDELSGFINSSLLLCLDGLQNFEHYDFEYGNMDVHSNINRDNVLFNVNYPITIFHAGSKTAISDFRVEIPIRLGYILDQKDEFLSIIMSDKNIDLLQLTLLDLDVALQPYNNENMVYSIIYNESTLEDGPLIFNFAVKTRSNLPPKLDLIPDFILFKGKEFVYQVHATDPDDNDRISYYSDNSLVNIDEDTGLISFIPMAEGDCNALICVRDRAFHEDCQNIKFMITNG